MTARATLKKGLFGGARLLGLNRLLRHRSRHSLLVLCYHGVIADCQPDDELRYSTTVSVEEFRRQLRILNRLFHPVSAVDVRDGLQDKMRLPTSPVLITFDDGFRNNLTFAAPELARQSTPAIVHVLTGYIGTNRLLWPQELVERVLRWPTTSLPVPQGHDVGLPCEPRVRRAVAWSVQASFRRAASRLSRPAS